MSTSLPRKLPGKPEGRPWLWQSIPIEVQDSLRSLSVLLEDASSSLGELKVPPFRFDHAGGSNTYDLDCCTSLDLFCNDSNSGPGDYRWDLCIRLHRDFVANLAEPLTRLIGGPSHELQGALDNFLWIWPDGKDFYLASKNLSKQLSLSTSSEETLSCIRSWLEGCQAEHTVCRNRRAEPTSNDSWYPSRLLDVGHASYGSCELVSGNSLPPGTQYMTLSHRWGAAYQVLKLTVDKLLNEPMFPTQSMSKTFREFVNLAQRLQIRYVWIDSLCIVQEGDDGADWQKEALTMSMVYRNSFCNISADWGSDSNGLYFYRKSVDDKYPRIQITVSPNRYTFKKFNGVFNLDVIVFEPTFGLHQLWHAPLSSRGWVVQERFLSPRNVRFSQNQVFFECCQELRSEIFPLKESLSYLYSIHTFHQPYLDFKQMASWSSPQTDVPQNVKRILQNYHNAVDVYSTCELTYESDKLIAFAGVGKFYQELLGKTYIAGLWLEDLRIGMMWRCAGSFRDNHNNDQLKIPESFVPSFSWASCRAEVRSSFGFNSQSPYSTNELSCIKYRVSPKGDDEAAVTTNMFGPFNKPELEVKVTGSLRPIRLVRSSVAPLRLTAIPYDDDDLPQEPLHPANVNLDFHVHESEVSRFISRWYYYMPWRQTRWPGLLFESIDSKMGRFRRIGIIQLDWRSLDASEPEVSVLTEDMPELGPPSPSELPSWYYDEATAVHTIFLI
ncbi:hypothetical protein B7494_g864 [Chlorociboria aeruginascens]|nr:hypothetical protein B7494_g864 [Chlorociboria aeruginascens]